MSGTKRKQEDIVFLLSKVALDNCRRHERPRAPAKTQQEGNDGHHCEIDAAFSEFGPERDLGRKRESADDK
jgi:hypothetical protein